MVRSIDGKIRLAAVALATMFLSSVHAAEDPPPASFITLKFEGECDSSNKHLWLANDHTFKTISVRVQWHAAGGKDLSEEFYQGPKTSREIGCAADAVIVEAKFAEF
ncbi:MAG TPA: hypothetical protein VFS47_02095 [Steroidobacteraceae bacterium]|nr:hypothetical protein [Steroidobacteraceae bacterium]